MKTGRKQRHYIDSNNNQIKGLSRQPDGRWRIIGTATRFTEPDETRAIEHFYKLTNPPSARQQLAAKGIRIFDPNSVLERILNHANPEAHFWRVVGEEIRKSPKLVAELTGIEQLGYFKNVKGSAPLPSLNQLETTWATYAKCSSDQQAKVKRAWRDFVETTKIKTLDEIVPEVIVAYQDDVYGRDYSGKQQLHLFSGVKRLLRFNKQRAIAIDEITKALSYLEILKPSESGTVLDPKPVERDDWKKLLAAAKGEDRAMILICLNAAMYLREAIRLEWASIKDGCIITNRGKTGKCIRVCTLWPETIEALGKIERKRETIFMTYAGAPLGISGAQRRFFKLTKRAGVPHVTASQLRDGAATAAIAANVNQQLVSLLLGHRTGIADHYVQRQPKMVAPACEAIYREYFG